MNETSEDYSGAGRQGSELETEFKQLRERHLKRFEQLSSLMASLQGISEEVQGEGQTIEALQQSTDGQLHYLKRSLAETVSSRSELEARVQELTEALEKSEQEKATLADQVGSAEAGSVETDALQSELDSHRAELETLRAQLAEKSETIAELGDQLEDAKAALQQRDQSLEEAQARVRNAEERVTALESELSELAGRGDESAQLRSELEQAQAALNEKSEALEAAQATLGEIERTQQQHLEELESLRSAHQQADATQEGLKTELLAVQRELESVREKYREGLSTEAALALRQQVNEMAEEVASLGDQLSEARERGKKSALAQQLTDAIQETERLEEENLRLKQQLGLVEEGREYMENPWPELEPVAAKAKPPQVSRSEMSELQRIQESAQKWSHGPKRVIGQILLDAGVISDEQLQTALELQKSNPQQHLGALLSELGFASDEAVAQARASQCGVKYIRFDDTTVDPAAATLITERLASQHVCIPISATDTEMVLAVTNPMDLLAIEDVERFTNRKVEVVVGTGPDIEQAINRYYWEPE